MAHVVRVPAEQRFASTVGRDHLLPPPVQRIMHIHVGSHGRAHAALRDPGVRVEHPPIRLQNPGFQPLPEQAQKGPVLAPHAQPLQPPVLVPGVEKALAVGLDRIPLPPVWPVTEPALDLIQGPVSDRLPCSTSGPVPITAPQNLRLVHRAQDSGAGCLEPLVFDHRDASWPLVAVALRDVVPTHQLRPVPLLLQPLHHCLDLRLQVRCPRRPRHALHPSGGVLVQRLPRT